MSDAAVAIRRLTHHHLQQVEQNIERLRFNTAIAEIRKFSNALIDSLDSVTESIAPDVAFAYREAADGLAMAISPMMPHLAEESWERLGHPITIAEAEWPVVDPRLATDTMVLMPVQVNGKKRGELSVDRQLDAATIEKLALEHEGVQRALEGRAPRKVIVVPGRIVNVVA